MIIYQYKNIIGEEHIYRYYFPLSMSIELWKNLIEKFPDYCALGNITINDASDIAQIPVTSRKDISQFDVHNHPYPYAVMHSTSGTTGKNLFIFHSTEAHERSIQRVCTMFRDLGILPVQTIFNMGEYGFSSSGRVLDYAAQQYGLQIIPLGVPQPDAFQLYLQAVHKTKPDILFGTPSGIFKIIRNLANKITIPKIVCSGSKITPQFKANIEAASGGRLYNLYGCNEVGGIALQISDDEPGLRVYDDGLCLEILDKYGRIKPEGKGDILVTDFHNHAFPFIRYKLGDEVHLFEEKGQKFLNVIGRKDNYFKIEQQLISKNQVTLMLQELLGHDEFTIVVSHNPETLRDIFMVRIPERDAQMIENIQQRFGQEFFFPVHIKFFSGDIKRSPSGKNINFVDLRFKTG